MSPSADWTATLDGLEIGAGTDYPIDEQGVLGLGLPEVEDADRARGDRDGTVAGPDRYRRRILTFPVTVLGDDAADAMSKLRELKTAFRRVDEFTEAELELRLPGFPGVNETLSYFGRPRGLDADLRRLPKGIARALCVFEALDPLGYEPESTEATGASGTFTVDNDGDENTDRVTIVVTGNGGKPAIENTTDASGAITFASNLAGGQERTIDLRARTVSDGGSDYYSMLSPVSTWFLLRPGENSLTLTGAANVDVVVRAAHG